MISNYEVCFGRIYPVKPNNLCVSLKVRKYHFRGPTFMPLLIGKSSFFYLASVAVAFLVRPRMGIYTSQICYKTKTKIKSLKRGFETCIIFSQFFILLLELRNFWLKNPFVFVLFYYMYWGFWTFGFSCFKPFRPSINMTYCIIIIIIRNKVSSWIFFNTERLKMLQVCKYLFILS